MVRPGLQRDALQQSSSQLNSGWTKKKQKKQAKNRRFDAAWHSMASTAESNHRLGLMAACHPTIEKHVLSCLPQNKMN
jgi:hypothetical protein